MLDELLSRRVLFVTGKGGTGKTTLSAALALLAARRGRRVLCIEVDAKGALPACLGSPPVPFEPRVVQPNISCLALHPEASLQEYLRLYFHVPRFTRMTPLAGVFDFVANSVPGIKDMLIVGKVAYEEKRMSSTPRSGARPQWDIIIVDSQASGHVLPQLNAARAMLGLVRGGIIRSQVEWIDACLADSRRTLLTICALPEEMPVAEALELHDRARAETRVTVGACFLNRTLRTALTPRQVRVLRQAAAPEHAEAAREHLGGELGPMVEGIQLAQRLAEASQAQARRLRAGLSCPVLEIPVQARARPGLATTRLIASALTAG